MPPTTDVNLNSTECLRTVSDFGVDHVHNICRGTVENIPWGQADWLVFVGIIIVVIVVIATFGSMALMMFRDTYR